MPVFLALATALAILVACVFAWPLRQRSHTAFAGLLLAVPLLALGLYQVVGTPGALDNPLAKAPATMEDAIGQLEAELQRNPQQVEGWRLLGRAYAEQQQWVKSRDAFARAAKLAPEDDDAQVDYAEARAKADTQRHFDDVAMALLNTVLQRSPRHQRARWFLGVTQRQRGQPGLAANTWESLLPQVDANTAAALRPQIDAARADAGLAPLPAVAQQPASTHAVTVKVALDPDFAQRVRLRGDTSVFVIARVPDGPPMPVAVEKHALQELPLTITLDDADGPMPTMKLSALKQVELIARLSASGNAIRQDGDLESAPLRVTLPSASPVELIIGNNAK